MSMHGPIALISLFLMAAAIPNGVAAQGSEPLTGTWKLNPTKSKFEPAAHASENSTVTNTISGNVITTIVDQVEAKGQRVHIEYTVTLDGADHPWKGTIDGNPILSQDGVSLKKLDDHTYHVENKLKGKVLTTNHIVVAKDGKSRTMTILGTNGQGQRIHHVLVFDKQ